MAKMEKSSAQQFLPQRIFVIRERDGDDSYLCAWENIDNFDPGSIVGEYTLTKTSTLRVERMLD